MFAARRLQIQSPELAVVDELRVVKTCTSMVRGALLEFHQRILRIDGELIAATILVVAIRDSRPTRVPEAMRRAMCRDALSRDN